MRNAFVCLSVSLLLGACGGGGGGGSGSNSVAPTPSGASNTACPYTSCSSFDSHTYAFLRPSATTTPKSLVIFLHGREDTREQTESLWSARQFANNNPDYAVAIPQGHANIWNFTSDVDWMINFVNHLQRIEGQFSNVYLVGYSNGSILSQQVACRQSGGISGVVSFAGPRLKDQPQPCSPVTPIAVSLIHGSGDSAVPINGSSVWGTEGAQQSFDFWAGQNKCSGSNLTSNEFNLEYAYSAKTVSASNCRAPVELTISNGGGHTPNWNPSVLHQTLLGFFNRAKQ